MWAKHRTSGYLHKHALEIVLVIDINLSDAIVKWHYLMPSLVLHAAREPTQTEQNGEA